MFRHERARNILYQVLLLAVVVGIGWWLVSNTLHNLESRKIQTGFGFLAREAGFEIAETHVEYEPSDSYSRAFLVGIVNTLLVAAIGVVLATVLGTLIGIARLSPNWLLAKLASSYVEVMRNVPLLLQLFVSPATTVLAVMTTFNVHLLLKTLQVPQNVGVCEQGTQSLRLLMLTSTTIGLGDAAARSSRRRRQCRCRRRYYLYLFATAATNRLLLEQFYFVLFVIVKVEQFLVETNTPGRGRRFCSYCRRRRKWRDNSNWSRAVGCCSCRVGGWMSRCRRSCGTARC